MKRLIVLLAIATITPYIVVLLGLVGIEESDWSNSSSILLAYLVLLLFVYIVLVIRVRNISWKNKFGWIVSLVFFFPFASLAMLYFLYWHPPGRVATNIEEQIDILRELQQKK